MGIQPELRVLRLIETIRHHFAFLFGRGFQLVSILFVDATYEDWQATIETDQCIIKIYSQRGKIGLALSIPQLYHAIGLLKLSDLLYGLDGEEDFTIPLQDHSMDEAASLMQIAQLLEKYIDTILENIRNMLALLLIEDHPTPASKLAQMFPYN